MRRWHPNFYKPTNESNHMFGKIPRKYSWALAFLSLSAASFHFGEAAGAELRRVADLNPGSVGSFPSNITVFADAVLFGAYTQATGVEPWRYDGTNIMLVRDINNTTDDIGFGVKEGNDSFPAWLTILNEKLYFSAFDPYRGGELWQYDGVNATRAADINPDANDNLKTNAFSSWPQELTVFNEALYFSANGNNVSTNYELWKYEGGMASLVADIHPASGTNHSSFPNGLTAVNGALYFMANDGANGYELWQHDGVNTILLSNINPGGSGSSSYPKYFTEFQGKVYFQAFHQSYGYELWVTDGTNVSLAGDLNPGSASSFPQYFTIYNNDLYFRATSATHGSELWKFDGVTISVAADINAGGEAYPKNLTIYDGALYFSADDGVHGWELWKFDGNNASLAADVNPWGDSFPEELVVQNGMLYFVATTFETGYEIYRFDGSEATLVGDINPGSGSSYPQFLTVFGDKVLFRAAEDGSSNWELWEVSSGSAKFSVTLSSPVAGSTYLASEAIQFSANVNPPGSVSQVEFFANGELLGSDSSEPYAVAASLPEGTYSITARGTDDLGATEISAAVNITVSSPNTPPSVTLTAPASGAEFLSTETITFTSEVSDDGGIAKVEFFANEQLIGTDASEPYSASASLPAGTYSVYAKATDHEQLSANSSTVQITVTAPNAVPSVVLTSPLDGAGFLASDTIVFSAEASDDTGVAKVEFFANGVWLGSAEGEPYSISRTLDAGSYTITAKATDNGGATGDSASASITVTGPADQPVITSARLEGNAFVINANGTTGAEYELEASADLETWDVIDSATASGGVVTFRDEEVQNQRFYRVVAP